MFKTEYYWRENLSDLSKEFSISKSLLEKKYVYKVWDFYLWIDKLQALPALEFYHQNSTAYMAYYDNNL